MSETPKSGFLPLDRRAFFGLAGSAAGLGALGAAPARAASRTCAEPDLTDATANAPGYARQPARRAQAQDHAEPLDAALKT